MKKTTLLQRLAFLFSFIMLALLPAYFADSFKDTMQLCLRIIAGLFILTGSFGAFAMWIDNDKKSQ